MIPPHHSPLLPQQHWNKFPFFCLPRCSRDDESNGRKKVTSSTTHIFSGTRAPCAWPCLISRHRPVRPSLRLPFFLPTPSQSLLRRPAGLGTRGNLAACTHRVARDECSTGVAKDLFESDQSWIVLCYVGVAVYLVDVEKRAAQRVTKLRRYETKFRMR